MQLVWFALDWNLVYVWLLLVCKAFKINGLNPWLFQNSLFAGLLMYLELSNE